jgi:hypothetical protein
MYLVECDSSECCIFSKTRPKVDVNSDGLNVSDKLFFPTIKQDVIACQRFTID